jgi:hypothetical protein
MSDVSATLDVDPSYAPKLPSPDALGPKMLACRERERLFVWAYVLNGGNGAAAARAAGYSDSGEAAKVRAHDLLHRERVLDAIHEVSWKSLRGLAGLATLKARRILEADRHPDQAKIIAGVWSRAGFAEKTAHEVHHSGSIELNHTDAALEALAYLQSMSVPEEKLVEQFGHSGLARYRRMLEERDAKRGMKVIDGASSETA